MKLLNRAVLVAFAFSAASGIAYAAGQSDKSMGGAAGATTGATSFSEADKDSNGYIDANEAAGVPGLDFNTADTDHDGRVSRSEFEAAMKSGGAAGGSPTTPGAGGSPSGGAGGSR